MLDAARLREILHYDPETGIFTWRRVPRSSGRPKDRPAGNASRRYLRIRIDCRNYLAGRLAWLYMTGEWPPDGLQIDHINGDGLDNRFANLRVVTRSKNLRAARRYVRYSSERGKWLARMRAEDRGLFFFGTFDTEEEAHQACRRAAATILLPKLSEIQSTR